MRILCLCFLLLTSGVFAQETESPYELSWGKDATWLGLGLAGTTAGFLIIQDKERIDEETIMNLNEDNIPFFDRWNAGNYDENLSKISDVPFYTSFAIPLAMLFTKDQSNHTGQISVMYLESLSTTAALFTLSAGLTDRLRPRTYNENIPLNERTESTNTRSFYSGHVAASATATFFAAKVWTDFNPDMKNKWLVWTGAALIPATVGTLRMEAGNHFFSDVLLGYALGAASGILVPELHKKKYENLSFSPIMGDDFQGVYLSYRF
ncbi:phosphatase PAP2 family protein [Leeuwenhoekiella sp. H156]|uniref:phosphatase PAP2 family protein n=1 Tax=Leeuwenhoekiella sp. H156 TaxID=3450128 RepID=UPI003FA4D1DD